MTVEANAERGDSHYNEFYKDGGWSYDYETEARWHKKNLIQRFGIKRDMRLLEVACGSGFHTAMMNQLGYECVGIDRSTTGIEWARAHYPGVEYHCCDLGDMPFPRGMFDVVFARGCSHYHYDLLTPKALNTTRTLMQFVKPGGVFVMIVISNLSGHRPEDAVWQNTLEDYHTHFCSFGLKYSVEWAEGMAICGLHQVPSGSQVKADEPASAAAGV